MNQRLSLDLAHVLRVILVVLIVCSVAGRFLYLDRIPTGLYIDETLPAAHALCISQTGTDLDGLRGELFHSPLVSGQTSAVPFVYVAPLSLWVKLFDAAPQTLRIFSALLGILTMLGIYLVARQIIPSAANWAVLLATLSPWSFMIFRMAWEVIMYPFLTVWIIYFWNRKEFISRLFSILLMILALYSYAPARVFVPLLLVLLVLFKFIQPNSRTNYKELIVLLVLFLFGSFFAYQMSSDAAQRFMQMSISKYEWLVSNFGASNLNTLLLAFTNNLLLHFSPSFLVFEGDSNLRHGIGTVGQWSWTELVGVFVILVALLYNAICKLCLRFKFLELQSGQIRLSILLLLCFMAAIVPAALTTEALPHALRSSTAWIFSTLLATLGISLVRKYLLVELGLLLISGLFFSHFINDYFLSYSERSKDYFDSQILADAQSLPLNEFLFVYQEHNPRSKAYYLMHNYQENCDFVRRRLALLD